MRESINRPTQIKNSIYYWKSKDIFYDGKQRVQVCSITISFYDIECDINRDKETLKS